MTTKRCNRCQEEKPARDFYLRGDGKLMGNCKLCHCFVTSRRYAPALREPGEHGIRELTGDELIPCARCHLRGPHECLRGLTSTGLGHQSWV